MQIQSLNARFTHIHNSIIYVDSYNCENYIQTKPKFGSARQFAFQNMIKTRATYALMRRFYNSVLEKTYNVSYLIIRPFEKIFEQGTGIETGMG